MQDQELLTAMHSSLNIRFGTTAPFSIGRHYIERVGFASLPAMTYPVSVRQQDVGAIVPIVRQMAYAELAERGIAPEMLEFTPNVGGSYRTRRFTDANPSSPSHGRQKMGAALELRFFLKPTLTAACEWTSYSRGRLPERLV